MRGQNALSGPPASTAPESTGGRRGGLEGLQRKRARTGPHHGTRRPDDPHKPHRVAELGLTIQRSAAQSLDDLSLEADEAGVTTPYVKSYA